MRGWPQGKLQVTSCWDDIKNLRTRTPKDPKNLTSRFSILRVIIAVVKKNETIKAKKKKEENSFESNNLFFLVLFSIPSVLPCNITVDVVYQGDCKARVWNNKYLVTITIQSNTTLHDTLYLYLYCPSDRQTNGIASLWLISFYNIPPLNSTYKPAENSYVNLRWVVVDSYCLAWAFSLIKSLQTATTCQLKILLETRIFFWELWTFCRK